MSLRASVYESSMHWPYALAWTVQVTVVAVASLRIGDVPDEDAGTDMTTDDHLNVGV